MRTYYREIHYTNHSSYAGMGYDSDGEFIYHGGGKIYSIWGRLFYEGNFENGVICGTGKQYFDNGKLHYTGSFHDGKFHGRGKTYFRTSQVCYDGEFAVGKYNGKGILYYMNGKCQYEGEFSCGKKCGNGREYSQDGILYYEGNFRNDRYHGVGTAYSKTGKIKHREILRMAFRLAKEPHFLKMVLPHTLAFTPTIFFTMKGPFWKCSGSQTCQRKPRARGYEAVFNRQGKIYTSFM